MQGIAPKSNRELFLPYAAPYFAYVLIASIPPEYIGPGWNYGLRALFVGTLLAAFWRHYPRITGPNNSWLSVLTGVVVGIAAVAVWIILSGQLAPEGGRRFEGWEAGARIAVATLTVPLFEELFVRRYILGVAEKWGELRKGGQMDALGKALDSSSVAELAPGAVSLFAALISTAAFVVGHRVFEWPAAFIFGVAMLFLWRARKDMLSMFSAHAAANLTLGAYVVRTGSWNLW